MDSVPNKLPNPSANPSPIELTRVAELVAGQAAELVVTAREKLLAEGSLLVDTKSSETDVVTAVDRESERFVRARLAGLRPGEPVIGEEEGGSAGAGGVTWVIDPIDGTVNFLYGFPWFAVSLAAQIDGVSVAGAVVEPVSGRRWTATLGGGAFLDGRQLGVRGPGGQERLELALVGTGFAYRVERRSRQARLAAALLGRVRDIRRPGAASLELCSVAAGWTDAYYEHGLGRWDWAAGALIAAEAGAEVRLPGSDPELGADLTFAAAPGVAGALRDALIENGSAAV